MNMFQLILYGSNYSLIRLYMCKLDNMNVKKIYIFLIILPIYLKYKDVKVMYKTKNYLTFS